MKRNVSLEEISDGRLYSANDLVKADCGGCQGCSECCHGMGGSIVLDPLDIARLSFGLEIHPEMLIANGYLELNVVDGLILPNLAMRGPEEACSFLNGEGRCSIHPHRPGICRLFPLGRFYHGRNGEEEIRTEQAGGFQYFLQVHECPKAGKTKVKVRKWVDTPDLKQYEAYIASWHYFLEDVGMIVEQTEDENQVRNISLYILKLFFLKPYAGIASFYEEFEARLEDAKNVLDLTE